MPEHLLPLQQQQQHSKGSSLTAEAADAPGSRVPAVTSRRHSGRLPSPGSDVSSDGCQAAPAAFKQAMLPPVLPLPLEDIHPGALNPADIEQLVLAAPQQQQQPKRGSKNKKQPQQAELEQQHHLPEYSMFPEQQQQVVPSQELEAQAAYGDAWALPATAAAADPTCGLQISSSLPQLGPPERGCLLARGGASSSLSPLAALGLSNQALLPPQLAALLQPGPQHTVTAPAAAAGLGPVQLAAASPVVLEPVTSIVQQQQQVGLPALLAQLLLSAGLPGAAAPQLLQQQQQQHQQATEAARPGVVLHRPPVKACYWHVYIAQMIADARRKQGQQQQQDNHAAGRVHQQWMQKAASVPSRAPAGAEEAQTAAMTGSPSKKQKTHAAAETAPAVLQVPQAPSLPGLLASTGVLAPNLALAAAAAAAAAAAGQAPALPLLPPAPLAAVLGALLPPPVMQAEVATAAAAAHVAPGAIAGLAAVPGALPAGGGGVSNLLLQLLGAASQPEAAAVGVPAGVPMPAVPGAFSPGGLPMLAGPAALQLQAWKLALPGLGLSAP